jgi:hypothetical protein
MKTAFGGYEGGCRSEEAAMSQTPEEPEIVREDDEAEVREQRGRTPHPIEPAEGPDEPEYTGG